MPHAKTPALKRPLYKLRRPVEAVRQVRQLAVLGVRSGPGRARARATAQARAWVRGWQAGASQRAHMQCAAHRDCADGSSEQQQQHQEQQLASSSSGSRAQGWVTVNSRGQQRAHALVILQDTGSRTASSGEVATEHRRAWGDQHCKRVHAVHAVLVQRLDGDGRPRDAAPGLPLPRAPPRPSGLGSLVVQRGALLPVLRDAPQPRRLLLRGLCATLLPPRTEPLPRHHPHGLGEQQNF